MNPMFSLYKGFIITETGAETLFPFMRAYFEHWLAENGAGV